MDSRCFGFFLGQEHHPIGIAIILVIVINGVFSFSQEYKADKMLSSLGNMIPKKSKSIEGKKLK